MRNVVERKRNGCGGCEVLVYARTLLEVVSELT